MSRERDSRVSPLDSSAIIEVVEKGVSAARSLRTSGLETGDEAVSSEALNISSLGVHYPRESLACPEPPPGDSAGGGVLVREVQALENL